jgi:putative transposase
MPRPRRYFIPGQSLHVLQRGCNGAEIFFEDTDRSQYLDWLKEAADDYGCAIHAYVLMPNHVHLLVTPSRDYSLPRMMQSLGRRYVRRINHTYGSSGTLWEGRYRAAPVDASACFIPCCRYIELNPVRAGLVKHPRQWGWSSYRANAEGKPDSRLTRHPAYNGLAGAHRDRARAYRDLFGDALDEAFLAAVRNATNGGWALGSEAFRRDIEKKLKRRAGLFRKAAPVTKRAGSGRRSRCSDVRLRSRLGFAA